MRLGRSATSRFVKLLELFAILPALAGLSCTDGLPGSEDGRPNIVIIVTDDQPSSTLAHMSHTNELLIREGTLFENFLINDPICCPSRATILLGQYRHNHLLEWHPTGCSYRFFEKGMHRRALGSLLGESGYRTGYVGKYLNDYDTYLERIGSYGSGDHLLVGWDEFHVLLKRAYYGFRMDQNGEVLRYLPLRGRYQTDVLSELARKFIRTSVDAGRPFFLFVAPDAPHESLVPASRHREQLDDARAPRGPSFNERDVSDQPSLRNVPLLSEEQVDAIDARYREVLRTLLAVDEMVKDIVDLLRELGALEKTYLLFTSDNGVHNGEHRIWGGKGTPFEESVRLWLAVRGPGVEKGRVLPQLTANVDILPTVLDIAGVEAEESIDGRSLLPLFGRNAMDVPWRNAIVLESSHERRNQGIPRFIAVWLERSACLREGHLGVI